MKDQFSYFHFLLFASSTEIELQIMPMICTIWTHCWNNSISLQNQLPKKIPHHQPNCLFRFYPHCRNMISARLINEKAPWQIRHTHFQQNIIGPQFWNKRQNHRLISPLILMRFYKVARRNNLLKQRKDHSFLSVQRRIQRPLSDAIVCLTGCKKNGWQRKILLMHLIYSVEKYRRMPALNHR